MRQPAALIDPRSSTLSGGTGTEAEQADEESAGGAHGKAPIIPVPPVPLRRVSPRGYGVGQEPQTAHAPA